VTGPAAPDASHVSEGATTAWHALSPDVVAARLTSDLNEGLDPGEAERRLARHGPNVLSEVRAARWRVVLARQFTNALIVVLLIAAAISVAVGERTDAAAIVAIVLLNGLLGFAQEWRAERAMAALRRMLSPSTTVSRGGRWIHVASDQLVEGDLVSLETGDRVPADMRMIELTDLRVDEAVLTGESLPVHKSADTLSAATSLAERTSMAWTGTTVVHGRAIGLVTATGMRTEFGRIAEFTQTVVREPTPLQRKLAVMARQLGLASVGVAAAVVAVGLSSGMEALEVFMTGVSLAVAVVPEGLPAVVTITLALGIRSMARRRALLRRLPAAETLGAATVICTDKTGTLTANEMTVRDVWLAGGAIAVTGSGYDPDGVFKTDGRVIAPESRSDLLAALDTGLSCSHARVVEEGGVWRPLGKPTEAAVAVAAFKAGLSEPAAEIETEFAFTSARKRMTVVLDSADGRIAHVKGAPEVLLERCTYVLDGADERLLDELGRDRVKAEIARLGESGRRTLALARRRLPAGTPADPDSVETELTLLGVLGMLDPPRPEVPPAVARAQKAGIGIVMITGDAPETGLSIARDVGLRATTAVTGGELESMSDEELRATLEGDTVFARTTPSHKLRIVERLQAMGHVVAMTGDGVNDAPALQRADVGIAMGIRGTDVARAASDIVITDDNFASIVGAVEEGRRQYDNIRKFTRYLLSSNAGEVVAILGNLLLRGPLILIPVQILWMNLVTDGVTALALGLEPAERGIMSRPPRDPGGRILDGRGLATIGALGLYIGLAALWLFRTYHGRGPEGVLVAQTMAFTGIVVLEKVNVFNFRALRQPLLRTGLFSNPRLVAAWFAMIGLQVAAVYVPPLQRVLHTVPLSVDDWLTILALATPVFLIPETLKWISVTRGERAPASR